MSANTAVVNSAYKAFAAGDIPTVLSLLSDDVSWIAPRSLPQGGEFHGRDEVLSFFMGIGAAWSSLTLRVESVGEVAPGSVVGIVRGVGELSGGAPSGYGAVHVFTLRDGLVTALREYTDLATPLVAHAASRV